MSDEQVNVVVAGSAAGVETAMRQSSRAVQQGSAQMEASLEEVGLVSERVSHKVEHLGISMTFAASALAEGSERGVTRAAHALAGLGFAFDPAVGVLTTGIALATERMIEFFHKAQEEAQKTREKFEQEMGQLANAGKAQDLMNQLRDVQFGQPFDEKGKRVKPSESISGAYEGSLADLEARFQAISKKIPRDATMAPRDLAEEYNKLSHELDEAREKAHALMEAIETLKSQPADSSALLPSQTTARSGAQIQKEWDEALKGIKGNLDSFGREMQAMDEARLKKKVSDEVSAARESIDEQHRDAMKDKEDREASERDFYKFLMEIDNLWAVHQRQTQEETAREWQQTFDVINSSWGAAVAKLRSGGDSVKNFWRDMWHELVAQSLASLIKIQEAHAAHWLAVHGITASGVLKDVALVLAGVIRKIAAYAAQAAAAAWAAIAAIPFVGPFLAPAIAAATLAGVLALASNVGGGGGGGGGGGASGQSASAPASGASSAGSGANFTIVAMDAQSMHSFLMKNAPSVAKAAAAGASSGVYLPNTPGRA